MKKYFDQNPESHKGTTKAKSISEVVARNHQKGTVYYHEVYSYKQPTHAEGIYSGDIDAFNYRGWSEPNSVDGEGDIHVIRLPNNEVIIYRVIGVEDWSTPRALRKLMEFNPVFKISRAGLGLIQSGLGNPPGAVDFNKDINGQDISVTGQLVNMGDGFLSLALSPTKWVKYAYTGVKVTYAIGKGVFDSFERYNSLPSNIRDIVKQNVFDQYFEIGSTVVELDQLE